MSNDSMEQATDSGGVCQDFNRPAADIGQAKCAMAAEIMKALDERRWSTRKAEQETGVNHADFARIRRANISRYSLERLVSILGTLGQEVELSVHVRPRPAPSAPVRVHS